MARERREDAGMLHFQIRKDRNFSNLVAGDEWLQAGEVHAGEHEPRRPGMVRLFRSGGAGQAATLPIWMLEKVPSEE